MRIKSKLMEIQDKQIEEYDDDDFSFYESNNEIMDIIEKIDEVANYYNIETKGLFPGFINELCFALYHENDCIEFTIFSSKNINYIKEKDSEVIESIDNIDEETALELTRSWASKI